jgi:uncharacterized membrane protein YGL010W
MVVALSIKFYIWIICIYAVIGLIFLVILTNIQTIQQIMRLIDQFLTEYGESHQNHTNKLIHWICVPVIVFSLSGIIMSIPVFWEEKTLLFNWASLVFAFAILYYIRLSLPLTVGFLFVAGAIIWGNFTLLHLLGNSLDLFYLSIILFVVAWIGQFLGHKIEGKKPSFLKDLQFLLIGPAWLMHFIYKKIGIPY